MTAVDRISAPEVAETTVGGRRVRWESWGDADAPAVVLIHGGGGNRRWWQRVAPVLQTGRRVLAVDLSGHGDSDRAPAYTLDVWAEDVLGMLDAVGAERAALVGHSQGGFVALRTAQRAPERLRGVVVVDSLIQSADAWAQMAPPPYGGRPHRVHPDRDSILAAYRLVPSDALAKSELVAEVGADSIRQTGGGWTWKFDPASFAADRLEPQDLTEAACDIVLMPAEYGLFPMPLAVHAQGLLGGRCRVVPLRGVGHHAMMSDPVGLAAAVADVLSDWRHGG